MTKPILTQYDPDAEDYVEVLPKDESKAMQQVLNKQTPTTKKRKEQASSLQLRTDNPGGRWLAGKLEDPSVKKFNSKGAPERFGEDTAYYSTDVLVPVSVLSKLKGAQGEHTFVREESLAWLKNFMEENNKLPPLPHSPERQYVPFIQVNYAGDAWINEGNHRIKVAKLLGWDYLPVRIQYHLGGEDISDGVLAPTRVKAYHSKALSEGYDITNFQGKL